MTVEDLQQAIKDRNLPAVLYLYGAEPYLSQQALRRIEKAVLTPGSEDFNRQVFNGGGLKVQEVIEACQTFPAFGERRLVIVKDAQNLSATDHELLMSYVEAPIAETCLIFSADKIDSRRKFFQILKKRDALIEFKPLSERQLPQFVRRHLEDLAFSITADALALFINRVGTGLHEVMTELEKLCLYAGAPRLLDTPDIQAVISNVRAENVFAIGNAVGRQDPGRALELGRHLVADGEAPLKILALLTRHYRQLWKVRELQAEGRPLSEIPRAAGVPPFVVEGLVAQGKRYSRQDFRRAFDLFVEADLAMKSSGAQAEVVLEQLLLRLASGEGA